MKYVITLFFVCTVLVTFCFSWVANAVTDAHTVHATVAGIEVSTLVDSDIASQLLNTNGQHLPQEIYKDLHSRLPCLSIHELPTSQILQEITNDYSTDTATALLIQCLSSLPEIQQSQQLFLSNMALQRAGDHQQAAFLAAKANEYLVLIVPGWGYQSNAAATGSDLSTPRQIIAALGFENHLVEVEDTGSVEGSARILIDALDKYSQSGKKIILVSASSGGPAVAFALNDPAIANNPQLVGWLNICGVLRGSPVIDTFLAWPRSLLLRSIAWYEGWHYPNLMSLSRRQSKPRYANFVPPAQLTIVNYIGIPFSGQVSEMGRDLYSMLKAQGPNDGLTLIPDALAPGYTIMAVGMDHFVNNDPDIDVKTAALLPALLRLIED